MRKTLSASTAIILAAAGVAIAQSDSTTTKKMPQATKSSPVKDNEAVRKSATESESKPEPKQLGQSVAPSSSNGGAAADQSTKSSTSQPAAANSSNTNKSNAATTPSTKSSAENGSNAQSDKKPSTSGNSPTTKAASGTAAPSSAPSGTNNAAPSTAAKSGTSSTNAQTPSAASTQTPAAASSSAQPNTQAGVNGTLNRDQETRISAAITSAKIAPVSNVNFSISVGAAVPSHVRLYPLPSTVISIVPQYRGYDYFVVRDEIIIVEPRTKKIVTVISSSNRAASTATRERVKFSDQDAR